MDTPESELPMAADFPTATREDWLALVKKVLKGGDFDRLVRRTLDGLAIEPLYTRSDAPSQVGAAFRYGTTGGRWDVRQLHAEDDPAAANQAILEDLAGGVTSLTLQIAAPGQFGLPYMAEALGRALEGVPLEACAVGLRAGEYIADAAGSLISLWRARGIPEAHWRGAFNADPLGTLAATGALYHPIPRSLAIAAGLAADSLDMPGMTALGVDGHIYHSAGASEAQELAAVLATLVAYLRALDAAGISPERGLPKIAVNLAVDADLFLSISKLRAARQLISRVAETCGAPDARVEITAETAWRMMTKRDPWVNMLRTTVACAAAAFGGADAITVLPFTWALGRPDAFARRIARSTQLVLMEEAALGRVTDPARGSWYMEKLTDDLAEKSWELFQEIEAQGGMGRTLECGFLQHRIAAVAEARANDVADGRLALVGTTLFPPLDENGVSAAEHPDPLPADLNGARVRPLNRQRLSEPFEGPER